MISGFCRDACRSATRSRLRWLPHTVQIMVKNTCGQRCVKLGMAAIEKLDRLRAGKARIAERRASHIRLFVIQLSLHHANFLHLHFGLQGQSV